MRKINVHIENKKLQEYPIFIGSRLLEQINSLVNIAKYSKAIIVTDRNIPESLVSDLKSALPIENSVVILDSGEQNKNLDNVEKILKKLTDSGCDRKSLVVNVGGGVTSDIGGFAASIFMRGIDFLQIPTTLLAQVDAGVGGKVGINCFEIKNLIGTFQQPVAVIIDIDTLATLPEREFNSGFAEIIKHGLIADKGYFQFVTSKKPQDFSNEELLKIIEQSCSIKTDIISSDEKEAGQRKLLNFGHTIGHAVEALSQETRRSLLHGEAVAIGMAAESKISNMLGLLSDKDCKQVEQATIQAGLPVDIPNLDCDEILKKIKSDKKNEKGTINWTLLNCIGQAVYDQKVDEAIVRKVL